MDKREGDQLLSIFAALGSPYRMRIIGTLVARGRVYVSQLAREIGISRPLVHLHLRKLEDAGLVKGELELSVDGKALKYFEIVPFQIVVTPSAIAEATRTLSTPKT